MSGSLGEREMLWEHELQASVSTAFSSSPKLSPIIGFLNNHEIRMARYCQNSLFCIFMNQEGVKVFNNAYKKRLTYSHPGQGIFIHGF